MLRLWSAIFGARRSEPATVSSGSELVTTTSSSVQCPSPLFEFLSNPGTHYPIYNKICLFLDIADIVALGHIKETSFLYNDLVKSQWCINNHLRSFFNNPQGFRTVQGQANAIIGGRFATLFFDRIRMPKDDLILGICVNDGDDAGAIVKYLTKAEYSFRKEDGLHVNPNSIAIKRAEYTREADRYRAKATIEIIYTKHAPLGGFLELLPMTHFACLITWNKAYCLFPEATFISKDTYLTRETGPESLRRATADGFKIRLRHWSHGLKNRSKEARSLSAARTAADKFSWVMKLDVQDVRKPSSEYPIEHANFSIAHGNLRNSLTFSHLQFTTVASPVLKHVYVVSNSFISSPDVRIDHFRTLTIIELMKLDPKQRPPLYDQLLLDHATANQIIGTFVPPETWTYHDDHFQKYLCGWIRESRKW